MSIAIQSPPANNKEISFGTGAHGTATALTIQDDVSHDAWTQILERVLRLSDSSAWWIGDALAHGEWNYGTKYRETLAELELTYDQARTYAYVANNIPVAIRIAELSFTHHRAVAKLVPVEQEKWLQRALTEGWTVKDLRDALTETEAAFQNAIVEEQETLEQLRLTIHQDRLQRYEAAATKAGTTIQDWALTTLDAAAA